MKWPIFLCCIWQITSRSYVLHVLNHFKLEFSYKKFENMTNNCNIKGHRPWYKDSIWCCVIASVTHPFGALEGLLGSSAVVRSRHGKAVSAPLQQRFDSETNWCSQLLAALFSFCVTAVMWHVIAWKAGETRKGQIYRTWLQPRGGLWGGLGSGIYNPGIAAFVIHKYTAAVVWTRVAPHSLASHI